MRSKIYTLLNSEGCLMDHIMLCTFTSARSWFKRFYCGKHKIHWYDEVGNLQEKNVRL